MTLINERCQEILAHITVKRKVTQPEIVTEFSKRWDYRDKNSARASISRMLKQLEQEEHIKKTPIPNPGSGGLDMNLWSPKQ